MKKTILYLLILLLLITLSACNNNDVDYSVLLADATEDAATDNSQTADYLELDDEITEPECPPNAGDANDNQSADDIKTDDEIIEPEYPVDINQLWYDDWLMTLERARNIPDIPPVNGQSQVPFWGWVEVEPLFAGRYTIADFIKDIPLTDINFQVVAEAAIGDVVLNIRSGERRLASLIIADDDWSLYEKVFAMRGFETDNLPQEYLSKKINSVRFFDFAGMGISFNIRGITHSSSADEVRQAFLNTGEDPNIMYTIMDVDPDANFESRESLTAFIGGIDRAGDSGFIPASMAHGYPRELFYKKTFPMEGMYSIYAWNVSILFPIDENGNVAGLLFIDSTHRN